MLSCPAQIETEDTVLSERSQHRKTNRTRPIVHDLTHAEAENVAVIEVERRTGGEGPWGKLISRF